MEMVSGNKSGMKSAGKLIKFIYMNAENEMNLATETLKDLLGIHREDIEEKPEEEPLGE